jgi:simple sugar transport system permease protein
MSLFWFATPFKNPKMGWFIGKGLRETIQLDAVGGAQILNNFLMFRIGDVIIPTGMLLLFGFLSALVSFFFRSKTGIAISAGGMNPKFAQAAGLNIDRNRIWANVFSNILGAIGIIIYSQSYGYAQLYSAPLMMAFSAVAAVLIGGATASRANVLNVVIGVILFQGLLTTALPVANEIFKGTDLSDIMRVIVQYGIILYALTQVKRGG